MKEIQAVDMDKTTKAILQAQNLIQWKPGKANPHLEKRIREHLNYAMSIYTR
jgi:hypothetical protein